MAAELSDGVIVLRPLTANDASAWHAGGDEEARRWFEFERAPTTAEVALWIGQTIADWRDGGPRRYFGICEVSSRRLSGGVEVRRREDGSANISWVVFPPFRGRSYATRAAVLAAKYALDALDVESIVAIVDALNIRSRAVAEAAGFQLEGPAEPWEYSETGEMLRYRWVNAS